MRIETISFIYNEEDLLPFFLKHYSFVDRMYFILDDASDDKTELLLKSWPKVEYEKFHFTDGFRCEIVTQKIIEVYKKIPLDTYVLVLDCDEFAFVEEKLPYNFDKDFYKIAFYNMFRHESESDLDIGKPIKEQRKYGSYDRNYVKPIFVKTGHNITFFPGKHYINEHISDDAQIPIFCEGAHWENADLSFCLKRRMSRKKRYSEHDIKCGYGTQNFGITEEQIIDMCKKHSNEEKRW